MLSQKIFAEVAKLTHNQDFTVEFADAPDHGDYATNAALVLAKEKGKNPREYATVLVKQLKASPLMDFVDRVEVAGPGFVNFWLKQDYLLQELKEIDQQGQNYGSNQMGQGKTVVIDYSSPNIAKYFGIGHLRSTIIGQALYNIYQFLGYRVIGDNHLGDWGTQFGKLLYMMEKESGGVKVTLDWLEKKYVEFHQLAEKDESLNDRAREWFKKLEDGDPKARAMWQTCVDVSLTEFNRIYERLGVKIDYAYGESFYEDLMPSVIADAKAKKLAHESQGALVIDIPGQKAPLILIKSDGATTYATRDLATLKFRQSQWQPQIIIYEVGVEQTLHFVQVFAAAKLLGYVDQDTELIHTKHGLYTDWRGRKLSTRKGENIKLEEILDEAIKRAKDLGCKDSQTAQQVGIGAIKYFDLKHSPQSSISFSWEKMFELQGNSGPYLQYTIARALSVLERATDTKKTGSSKKVSINTEEMLLMRELARFSELIITASKSYSLSVLCEYLFGVAQKYNSFYNQHKVIGSENESFRLSLCRATAVVLTNGLSLLGIESPQRM